MATRRVPLDPRMLAGVNNRWNILPAAYDDESGNPQPDIAPTNAAPPTPNFFGSAFRPANSQPNVVNDIYAPQLRDVGEKLSAAFQPPQIHGVGGNLRAIAGALVSARNPQLGSIISGDYGRMRNIGALQNQYKLIEDAINQNRTMQTTDITNRLHNAQADYFEQRPDLMSKPKQTPDEMAFQDYLGKVNPATNKNFTPSEARAQMAQDVQDTKPEKSMPDLSTHTVVVGNRVKQYNPKTHAFDIDMGPSPKSEKPNPVETTFDKANAEQVSKDLTTARGADFRLRSMTGSYKDAVNSNDQQAMLNLLTNHIGMTLGLQKGARITKDILHEATNSTPWLQGVEAKFDSDGYLSGVVLTKPQMDSMMKLAHSQRQTAWQQAHDSANQAGLINNVKWPSDFKPEVSGTTSSGGVQIIRDANGRIIGVK